MNIEELCGRIHAALGRIDSGIENLERERNYILSTMNKLQSNFGDQSAGQQAVTELYRAINSIAAADSSLNALRVELGRYTDEIKRR